MTNIEVWSKKHPAIGWNTVRSLVQDGMVVVCLDGNPENQEGDNLAMVYGGDAKDLPVRKAIKGSGIGETAYLLRQEGNTWTYIVQSLKIRVPWIGNVKDPRVRVLNLAKSYARYHKLVWPVKV